MSTIHFIHLSHLLILWQWQMAPNDREKEIATHSKAVLAAVTEAAKFTITNNNTILVYGKMTTSKKTLTECKRDRERGFILNVNKQSMCKAMRKCKQ